MSDDIKPALTPEEWRQAEKRFPSGPWGDGAVVELRQPSDLARPVLRLASQQGAFVVASDAMQAVAALCLYNQPFGFTREDVDLLQQARLCLDDYERPVGGSGAEWVAISRLAAKIAALLPPEETR